jgi:glycosyltransferase involved in cell wall biosynthesis
MQRRVRHFKKTVGFATFETFEPPQVWTSFLNDNDAVICPSKFNVEVFKAAGITKPIYHIPHCIDTELYNPGVEPAEKSELFTFLFLGTWKKRKGYPQLLEAWIKEFDIHDKVRLVIKTDRLTMARNEIEQTKQRLGLSQKEIAPIVFETRVLTEVELPKFIRGADCLISPTLGEGFGLPGLQAMALGVPVAITNFSGCCDYANDQTATLIEPAGFILLNELDKIHQFEHKKWAHVKVETVQSTMRSILTNPEPARAKAQVGAKMVAEQYNYETTATRFEELLKEI